MKLVDSIFSGKVIKKHKDMDLSLLTLRFKGKKEEGFNEYYFDYSIDFLRISSLFCIGAYLLFYVMDLVVFPKYKMEFLAIRLIICFPIAFAALIFSYAPVFRKIWQGLLFLITQISALGIITMILFSETTLQRFYFIGLLLVLVYNYLFSKIKFVLSTVSGWSIFLLYVILVNLKT